MTPTIRRILIALGCLLFLLFAAEFGTSLWLYLGASGDPAAPLHSDQRGIPSQSDPPWQAGGDDPDSQRPSVEASEIPVVDEDGR